MMRSVGSRSGLSLLVACWTVAAAGVPVASGAQAPAAPQAPPAAQAARPSSAAPASGTPTYRIGAGDALQLFVWKEPELTHEVTVRIDGRITVALLGDVQAAGRSPAELGADIANGLQRFVASPVVTVAVSQPRSTRFFVLGMVGRPGEFPMAGPTTVVQALAVAGGFRDYAKTGEIMILRGQGRQSTFLRVNYDRLVSGRDSSQNILLEPGDTVLVP